MDRSPWRAEVDGTVARLAVAGGAVYAGCGSAVYALDAASGRQLWCHDTGTPGPFRVAGDTIYVTGGGRVRALDVRTGGERWQCPGVIPSLPAADADRVCVLGDTPRWGRSLRVLDARTGAERWRIETESRLSAPATIGDLVVVGFADGALLAFKARNGKVRWRVNPEQWHPDWPDRGGAVTVAAAVDGTVYAAGIPHLTPPLGFVAGIDAARGRIRWVTIATLDPGPERPDEGDAPVLPVQDGLWFGGPDGLTLLDGRAGAVRVGLAGPDARFSPPAVHGALLVAGLGGRRVEAYDVVAGRSQWALGDSLSPVDAPPAPVAVAGDRVIIGSVGWVWAVDARTGQGEQ
ncbi:PQQ-binding-like beta-propeller repeat protein [Actinomadura craniellae]|uniref:PQQ-binding-like beta-propeller repeat protein n=1 Tax=Actinomadura craniellae TaxID=2231787 RepID=UPI001314A3AC|nr:PQQ-binding-like beta-propeller repeat protein [Actinomadura craniellae]